MAQVAIPQFESTAFKFKPVSSIGCYVMEYDKIANAESDDTDIKLISQETDTVFVLLDSLLSPSRSQNWLPEMKRGSEKNSNLEQKKWKEELSFFKSIKINLLNDPVYKGQYIAIKDKKIIDSDSNEFSLAKRIDKKFSEDVVLIVKVEKELPTAQIPTPFIAT